MYVYTDFLILSAERAEKRHHNSNAQISRSWFRVCVCVALSCLTLCDPMDHNRQEGGRGPQR